MLLLAVRRAINNGKFLNRRPDVVQIILEKAAIAFSLSDP